MCCAEVKHTLAHCGVNNSSQSIHWEAGVCLKLAGSAMSWLKDGAGSLGISNGSSFQAHLCSFVLASMGLNEPVYRAAGAVAACFRDIQVLT